MSEQAIKEISEARLLLRDIQEGKRHSIELDCAPGSPRPCQFLPQLLEGTGIVLDAQHPTSMFFGNWVWVIPIEQNEAYEKVKPLIKKRIEELYHHGKIRYGSW